MSLLALQSLTALQTVRYIRKVLQLSYCMCAWHQIFIQTYPDCEFFVWRKDFSNCSIMKAYSHTLSTTNHFTGEATCNVTFLDPKSKKTDLLCQGLRNPPGCTCFEVNTDYNTARMDLESFNNVASPQDCQDLCVKNPDCLFWTYLTTGHPFGPSTCWLKDHILSKQKNDIRKFSGPRICSHLP